MILFLFLFLTAKEVDSTSKRSKPSKPTPYFLMICKTRDDCPDIFVPDTCMSMCNHGNCDLHFGIGPVPLGWT
ncbi:unnamed protein product [Trifolium pratense]|uniref:Uncharacterized protein n=1 Tax=Trifolium pratense TaxID=57577 RepID=A0ACB0IXS0_TRIPR|nr:unnamed protein product [Trifolium pratense]